MSQTSQSRAYSAAHFLLELDQGESAGFIRSVEGGGIKSETLTYQGGDQHGIYRSQGMPKYDDIKIQVGMSMSRGFYNWIEAFFTGQVVRRSGAIVAGDFHYKERARRTFRDALISEVTLPKFDGADKNPCYMGISLCPEELTFESGAQTDLQAVMGSKQKLWSPNHFDFAIDGFEQATKRTVKIEGFTIKQQINAYRGSGHPFPINVPGKIEWPNLTFYVPESDAQPLINRFDKAVVKGKREDGRMTGHITIKDNDGGELCVIDIYGIEIAGLGPDKSDASSKEIKQVRVEIAVESMKFNYGGQATDK